MQYSDFRIGMKLIQFAYFPQANPIDIPANENSAIQPFLKPMKYFHFIFRRYCPALMQRIMMSELTVSISVPVNHDGLVISWPYVDMKMGIRRCLFIETVHQTAPIA